MYRNRKITEIILSLRFFLFKKENKHQINKNIHKSMLIGQS